MQPLPSTPGKRFSDGITSLTALGFLLLLAGLLPSLANAAPPVPTGATGPAAVTDHQANDLANSIKLMARELATHLDASDAQAGELTHGIAVCSFVDLKKLTRTSSFGRYLAEQLMSEFQQRGYRVMEMRKTANLLIQEKRGEYGLSRNPEELLPSVAAGAMLTGTYTLAGDHILVNAKIIDNRNAAMLSSATLVFPRTPMIAGLLSDSVSASTGEQEVVYMKRLEL